MSVVLTVVKSVVEAEVIVGLLRTEGIPCYPETPLGTEYAAPIEGGYEIRVAEADYERARDLIDAGESGS